MKAFPEDHLDVLFIGGDADLAEIYRMKLELDGYLVRIVHRDEEWPASPWRPDIAYLDVQDGQGIGVRGHRRLRSDPVLQDVPAVILSTLRPHELSKRGFVLGPMDYLVTVSESFHAGSTIDRLTRALLPAAVVAKPN